MTQPSEGFLSNPDASGVSLAYVTIGGYKVPVVMVADDSGHIAQSLPTYSMVIKAQAGAAAKDHWDLFNAAGSGKLLELRGLWIAPSLIATVTGTIAPDFDLFRTSAVGTGGSAVGYKGALTVNMSPMDTNNAAPPAQVTARVAPTGGATSAEYLLTEYVSQEESQAGSQMSQFFNILPDTAVGQRYAAHEGEGFKLRQVTLGVAQNFTFYVVFTLV